VRWAMGVRVSPELTVPEVGEFVRRVFQSWLPLFPGPVQVQNVTVQTPLGESPEGLAGLRAKLTNTPEDSDYIIRKDLIGPKLINCIGIDSPGLTASLAIAEYVEKLENIRRKLSED